MKRVDEKFRLLTPEQERSIEDRLKAYRAQFGNPMRWPDKSESAGSTRTENEEASGQEEDMRPTHKVFDEKALGALVQFALTNDNLKSRVRALQCVKPDLPLVVAPEDWSTRLQKLRCEWPNFSAVIDQVETDFAIGQAMIDAGEKLPINITPMVMVGPPGCGKSSFMQALSDALELPLHRRSLETMMTSSDLFGSSRTYSNSEPGALFNMLTGTGGVAKAYPANFLLACDELDKISGDDRFKPVNVLLSLLEPSTNKNIMDASAQIEMDLSRLNILFTANDLQSGAISEPLLSRLTVMQIEPLSHDQMRALTTRMYADLVRNFKMPCEKIPKLTEAGIQELAKCASVREQKAKLKQALGRALVNRSPEIKIQRSEHQATHRIGFY